MASSLCTSDDGGIRAVCVVRVWLFWFTGIAMCSYLFAGGGCTIRRFHLLAVDCFAWHRPDFEPLWLSFPGEVHAPISMKGFN